MVGTVIMLMWVFQSLSDEKWHILYLQSWNRRLKEEVKIKCVILDGTLGLAGNLPAHGLSVFSHFALSVQQVKFGDSLWPKSHDGKLLNLCPYLRKLFQNLLKLKFCVCLFCFVCLFFLSSKENKHNRSVRYKTKLISARCKLLLRSSQIYLPEIYSSWVGEVRLISEPQPAHCSSRQYKGDDNTIQ